MASGPVRVAIIAGAVVVGAVIISKGFPASSGTPIVRTSTPSPTTSSPTPGPHRTTTPPPAAKKGHRKGVIIGVYNATRVTGLAGNTGNTLAKTGYVIGDVGDFPSQSNVSFIYYRGGAQAKADALLLQKSLFKPAKVQPMPANSKFAKKTVELAVVLGNDFASTHPVG